MKSISLFICYRRVDGTSAHLIETQIRESYPNVETFIDVNRIPPGRRWQELTLEFISESDAVLVVIGPNWVHHFKGKRIKDERDHVLAEIEAGIAHGIPLVPILVDGAVMPPQNELPQTIQDLSDHNATQLTLTHLRYDIDNIIRSFRDPEYSKSLPNVGKGKLATYRSWWLARMKFQAELSAIYHQRRARFYGALHSVTETLVLIFGSLAFVGLFFIGPVGVSKVDPFSNSYSIVQIFGFSGLIIVIISLLDRSLRWSEKETENRISARGFHSVLTNLNSDWINHKSFRELQNQIDNLSSEEFYSSRRHLEQIVYNEMILKHGLDHRALVPVVWWHRLIAQFSSIGSDNAQPQISIEDDLERYVTRMVGLTQIMDAEVDKERSSS